MEKTKEAVQKICELKKQFIQVMDSEMMKGASCVDTKEAGDVVDMIKDCAEAEEKLWKALYYKKIVEAMDEAEKEEECTGMPWYAHMFNPDMMERSGYDHWRYDSGRFAPTGHGHRSGFVPTTDPMMGGEWNARSGMTTRGIPHMGRMGFDDASTSRISGEPVTRSGHGDSYDMWQDMRRHYHETKSPSDKAKMDEHAQKHMRDAMMTMRDIWAETDPDLKKKMKTELASFVNELA